MKCKNGYKEKEGKCVRETKASKSSKAKSHKWGIIGAVAFISVILIGAVFFLVGGNDSEIKEYPAPDFGVNPILIKCTYRTDADPNFGSDVATFWQMKIIRGQVDKGDVITMDFPDNSEIHTKSSIRAERNFYKDEIVNQNINWAPDSELGELVGDEIYFYGVAPFDRIGYRIITHSKNCNVGNEGCGVRVLNSGSLNIADCGHW